MYMSSFKKSSEKTVIVMRMQESTKIKKRVSFERMFAIFMVLFVFALNVLWWHQTKQTHNRPSMMWILLVSWLSFNQFKNNSFFRWDVYIQKNVNTIVLIANTIKSIRLLIQMFQVRTSNIYTILACNILTCTILTCTILTYTRLTHTVLMHTVLMHTVPIQTILIQTVSIHSV